MYASPFQLQPISTSHYFVSGDVTIHEGVAIAPGVLLQADPDSRIVIHSGVCIGIGAILHAHAGVVEIGEGANIGAGVLLVGQVKIGAHACVGSATTVLDSSVELGQVIPPGSLIGDQSRRIEAAEAELQATDTVTLTAEPVPEPAIDSSALTTAQDQDIDANGSSGVNVYGKMYVNQLLVKLFPHKQQLDPPPSEPDPWDEPT